MLNSFEQQKLDFERKQNEVQNRPQSSEDERQEDLSATTLDKVENQNISQVNEDNESTLFNDSQYIKRNHDDHYFNNQKDILNELDNQNETLEQEENQNENDIKGTVSASTRRRVPYMEVVGQVHGTYIIAQNENGMFMIDQHAAQERIKYEYFREKIGEVTNEVQNLLIPMTFHFSKDEQFIIDQYQEELDRVGVHLEHFGGHDYIVNSYPVWFPKAEAEEIIKDMIELVLENKKLM